MSDCGIKTVMNDTAQIKVLFKETPKSVGSFCELETEAWNSLVKLEKPLSKS